MTSYALSNRSVIFCVTAILVGWGVFVYLNAPRKEDPAFVIRDAGLITVWPGATAEQVETLVTRLTALLEPILILIMVGIVVVIILATLVPLLNVTTSLGG